MKIDIKAPTTENNSTPGALSSCYLHFATRGKVTKEEIKRVKEHCESVLANPDSEKYTNGVNPAVLFSSERVENYYGSRIEQYGTRAANFDVECDNKELANLDKLFLSAKVFAQNFFSDMESSRQGNKKLYPMAISKILEMYSPTEDGKHKIDIKTAAGKKEFIRMLEAELASRLNLFLRKQYNPETGKFDLHSISAITALTNLTKSDRMGKFFLNVILSKREDIREYAESKYRESISSIYSIQCVVPDIAKMNKIISEIEVFGRKELGINNEAAIRALLGSAAGLLNGTGEKYLKTVIPIFMKIKEFCNKELGIEDNEVIVKFISSVTCMLHGTGGQYADDIIPFFYAIKSYSENKLAKSGKYIVDGNFVLNFTSRVAGRLTWKGVPERNRWLNVFDEVAKAQSL